MLKREKQEIIEKIEKLTKRVEKIEHEKDKNQEQNLNLAFSNLSKKVEILSRSENDEILDKLTEYLEILEKIKKIN